MPQIRKEVQTYVATSQKSESLKCSVVEAWNLSDLIVICKFISKIYRQGECLNKYKSTHMCVCSFVKINIHQVRWGKCTRQYTIQNTEIKNTILGKKGLMECVETTTLIDNNIDYFFHFSSILSLTSSAYTL